MFQSQNGLKDIFQNIDTSGHSNDSYTLYSVYKNLLFQAKLGKEAVRIVFPKARHA